MDRRSITSAANGRLSKGPTTAAGKERSSQNATKHGLLSSRLVLQDESQADFEDLHDQHIRRFQPADPIELRIVEELTAAVWRLRRAWSIELNLLDSAADQEPTESSELSIALGFDACATTPGMALVIRYQNQLQSAHARALRSLHTLRTRFRVPQTAALQPPVQIAAPRPIPVEPPQPNEPKIAAAAAGSPPAQPPQPNEPISDAATPARPTIYCVLTPSRRAIPNEPALAAAS